METEQKCKQCGKVFRTSMELLNHEAKEHQEEEEGNGNFQSSTPKCNKEGKGSSFV